MPTGPGFDIVLVLHIVVAVIGLGAVVVSGVQAQRLHSAAPGAVAANVTDYFAPGVNWAGRALVAVPIFGFVLLVLSGGVFTLKEAWVQIGLVLWVAATGWAEGVLWPGERRVQALVSTGGQHDVLRANAGALRWHAAGVAAVLVVAFAVMIAQP